MFLFTTILAQSDNFSEQFWGTMSAVGIFAAVFVLPFIVSYFLSRALKMSDYSMSIGIILAAIVAAAFVVNPERFRYGTDINGGTTLVYELDKDSMGEQNSQATAKELVASLTQRLNPSGTSELVIRALGPDQIEIIVPNVDQLEIENTKRIISQAGILKFRIVANSFDHKDIRELAVQQASNPDPKIRRRGQVTNPKGDVVGLWQRIGRDDEPKDVRPIRAARPGIDLIRDASTGEIVTAPFDLQGEYAFEKYLEQQNIGEIEMLIALERRGRKYQEVSGEDLKNVKAGTGNRGFQVDFTMKASGAGKLYALTKLGEPRDNLTTRMAIILDGTVLSAPQLNSAIRESGYIEGNFTPAEVNFMVDILNSGALPAALKKQPISQFQSGAVLGADTIRKGFTASAVSLVLTLVCVLLYYRFAGLVACIALMLNILFILAAMILIQQPITLPGLAGLVLTVGMSVDANVLIFERIREERKKNAAPRMAIRNGFERAFTTIVDSNLTTLITAVVLYSIGTDQVRGFAVVLIIGILISMFTAVFCSRIMFDIAERWRLANLSMTDGIQFFKGLLIGDRELDFMSMRKLTLVGSLGFILVGLAATFFRGKNLLDIDFNGGSSVTFMLDRPLEADSVRSIVGGIFDKDENDNPIQSNLTVVKMDAFEPNTVYRLDSSLKEVDLLKSMLTEGFREASEADLVTYTVSSKNNQLQGVNSSILPNIRWVSMRSQEDSSPDSASAALEQDKATVEPSADSSTQVESGGEVAPGGEVDSPGDDSPDGGSEAIAEAVPTAPVQTTLMLAFGQSKGDEKAKIDARTATEKIVASAEALGMGITEAQVLLQPIGEGAAEWNESSNLGFSNWEVALPLNAADAQQVVDGLQTTIEKEPVLLAVYNIGERVAGQMKYRAIMAMLVSMIFIVGYIWFRFQRVAYGLAAVVALVHDVLITLGILALTHWLYRPLGFLLLEDFKVSLTTVAAFLTIIGYSLNDTIVVFDRIREVKGKSPTLNAEMINQSINQTLSRTLLTSSTTLIVVVLLYVFGGEGLHGFAFCLLVGILVGTYSSIYVASPVLLWLVKREEKATLPAGRRMTQKKVTA